MIVVMFCFHVCRDMRVPRDAAKRIAVAASRSAAVCVIILLSFAAGSRECGCIKVAAIIRYIVISEWGWRFSFSNSVFKS